VSNTVTGHWSLVTGHFDKIGSALDPKPSTMSHERSPPDAIRYPLNAERYSGTFGDLGIFSFGRGKPFSLLGGGAVVVNNPQLVDFFGPESSTPGDDNDRLFFLKYLTTLAAYSLFFHPRLYWVPSNLPWLRLGETYFTLDFEEKRMHSMICRLGSVLIEGFQRIRQQRIMLARQYRDRLTGFSDAFDFIPECSDEETALLRFPVILKSTDARNAILKDLKTQGLGATGMYPVPLNEQEGLSDYLTTKEAYPNAKRVAEGLLTLPLHEYVTPTDIDRMHSIFHKHLASLAHSSWQRTALGVRLDY